MMEGNGMPTMMMNPYLEETLVEKTSIEMFKDGVRYSKILKRLNRLHSSIISNPRSGESALEEIGNFKKMFDENYILASRIEKSYDIRPLASEMKEKFHEDAKNILKLLRRASDE